MTFVHPAFLAALAALAIPLAIHFLRSWKLQPLDLGTLRFVHEALAEVTRWERLRDWLLLALRLAMVGLAAFLFARPFVKHGTPPEQAIGSELICVLDASASTRFVLPGAAEPGAAPANAALDAFAARLAAAPAGGRTVALALADSLEPVADAAAAAPLVGGPCDFAALARWLTDHVAAAPETPRRVVFFTDLQQPLGGLPADVAWPQGVPIEIVGVLPPSTRNLAAGGLRERVRPLPDPVPDGAARTARAHGADGAATIAVPVVSVGGVAPQAFTAAAGAGTDPAALNAREYPPDAREIDMSVVPPGPGDLDAVASIRSGDPWPLDDQRAYVVRFVGRQPVLLVDGEPGDEAAIEGGPFAAETYYLRHALATPDRGQAVSSFDVAVARSLPRDLDARPWKAVALCNVAAIDDETLATLAAIVEAGAGLLLFPGSRFDAAAWGRIHAAGLCPAALVPSAAPPVPRPLLDWDRAHPALVPFATRSDGDLSRIVLRDAFDVTPDAGAVVVASLAGGRPVLVTKQLGRGRVVLFANPADRGWTDFPSERLYLPFMQSLVRYAAQVTSRPDEGLPPDRPLALADRRMPNRYPDAVVHVPVEESTFPFLGEDAFRSVLGLGAVPAPLAVTESEPWRTAPGAVRPREWWPWLAVGLLTFIIVEPFLADHKRLARARLLQGSRP